MLANIHMLGLRLYVTPLHCFAEVDPRTGTNFRTE